jgi:hypothetical protein
MRVAQLVACLVCVALWSVGWDTFMWGVLALGFFRDEVSR